MKAIGAFEAKTHLSALLDKVAQGESFVITKRGKPVAALSPVHGAAGHQGPREIIGEFRRQFGRSLKPFTPSEIAELKGIGRK